jgi:hypothetical protein
MKEIPSLPATNTITLSWYDDEEMILYFTFGKSWNWEEFFTLDAESNRLVGEKDYVVDSIFDFSSTVSIPEKVLTNFARAAKGSGSHPNHGVTVAFGVGMLMEILGRSVQRIVRSNHVVIAKDVDEALAIIGKQQASRVRSED